jgi:hypothetical protein
MATPGSTYPVVLDVERPQRIANWRPLVHWFLAFPHFVVLWGLAFLESVLLFISFFTILFTKRIPEEMFNVIVMINRYNWRVVTYTSFMRESYPPFDFTVTARDPGTDPATLTIEYPTELARFMPLVKWLLAIPHFIVLTLLLIAGLFAAIAAFLAVLFTGRYPEGMLRFLVGLTRWAQRVGAYAGLLTDQYPPFTLE